MSLYQDIFRPTYLGIVLKSNDRYSANRNHPHLHRQMKMKINTGFKHCSQIVFLFLQKVIFSSINTVIMIRIMTYQVIPWLVFVFLPWDAILAELDSVLCNPVWLVTTIGFKSTLSPNWANNALCFECNL